MRHFSPPHLLGVALAALSASATSAAAQRYAAVSLSIYRGPEDGYVRDSVGPTAAALTHSGLSAYATNANGVLRAYGAQQWTDVPYVLYPNTQSTTEWLDAVGSFVGPVTPTHVLISLAVRGSITSAVSGSGSGECGARTQGGFTFDGFAYTGGPVRQQQFHWSSNARPYGQLGPIAATGPECAIDVPDLTGHGPTFSQAYAATGTLDVPVIDGRAVFDYLLNGGTDVDIATPPFVGRASASLVADFGHTAGITGVRLLAGSTDVTSQVSYAFEHGTQLLATTSAPEPATLWQSGTGLLALGVGAAARVAERRRTAARGSGG